MSTRLTARTRALLETSDLEITLPELADRGGWGGVFETDPEALRLRVEIGIGKDPHIVTRAENDPDRFFIGIEHSKKKLDKVHAKAIRRRVRNLRLLRADIFRVLDPIFPDGSIEMAWLLFPDPWPKKRHRKKRMVQHWLLDTLARKMPVGSDLELRTDHPEYKDQMVKVLRENEAWQNLVDEPGFLENPLEGRFHVPTLFETKYRARGLVIHYLYAQRVALENEPEVRPPCPLEELRALDPLKSSEDEPLPQRDDSDEE